VIDSQIITLFQCPVNILTYPCVYMRRLAFSLDHSGMTGLAGQRSKFIAAGNIGAQVNQSDWTQHIGEVLPFDLNFQEVEPTRSVATDGSH
jgi:hypothetical protein